MVRYSRSVLFLVAVAIVATAFSAAAAPALTSISPTSGYPGTQVTYTGTGFGATQGTGSVWLGSKLAGSIVSWSNTQIVAVVASGAASGSAQVQQGGTWSNAISFTVIAPSISSISPTSGYPGMQVTINGTNFGATQGTGSVWLGNKLAGSIVSWSNTQIVAVVASNALSGSAQVQQMGVWSNSTPFTVIQPNVTSISPSTGIAGTQVTINGTNFGATQGTGSVWLGSKLAGSIVSWSSTQIVATVASGSVTGSAQVQQGGVWSNSTTFTVLTPSLTSISPTTAVAGDQITINGTNFGASQGSGSVWLGSKYAGSIVSWSNTQVVATVASGTVTGTAQVQQGGVWSNAIALTVITPHIDSLNRESAPQGIQVIFTGTGFGASQGSGSVWLGNKYATIDGWSDTEIVATVAAGSATGTGTAQVQQGGVWSNAIPFEVTVATLEGVWADNEFIGGGFSENGAVYIDVLAPSGGLTVTLSSDNASAIVPASVTIPQGEATASFTIDTLYVTSLTEVTISATFGATTLESTIFVLPPAVRSAWFDDSQVHNGDTVTGHVELYAPAPAGGVVVDLSSSDPSLVSVPATMTVPEGEIDGTFTATVEDTVATATLVEITAELNGFDSSPSLEVQPPYITGLTFTPSTVTGGEEVTAEVTLSEPAVADVEIEFDATESEGLPPALTIPAGFASGEVTFTAGYVNPTETVIVEAYDITNPNGPRGTANLTIERLAVTLDSVTATPQTVIGTNTSTIEVFLTDPAPEDGIELDIDAGGTVRTPPFIVIPENESSITFDVELPFEEPNGSSGIPVHAYHAGTERSVWISVLPTEGNYIDTLELAETRTAGGNLVTATITLAEEAGDGGAEIALSTDNSGVATVPATVTVPEGETTVTFDIDTDALIQPADVVVRAEYNDVIRKERLTVVPSPSTVNLQALEMQSSIFDEAPTAEVEATVVLSGPAPSGGITITLGGSRTGLATVPATVTVPQSETSATFTITTVRPERRHRRILVTATYDGITRTAPLKIIWWVE